MIGENVDQDPGQDIVEAVQSLGGEIDSVEALTSLRAPRSRHGCFRLELGDGRTVKGRRFAFVQKRESVTSLYPTLRGLPFSRLLAVKGAATIEEWIHGSALEPDEQTPELTSILATVLGTLHTRSVPPGNPQGGRPNMNWFANRLTSQLTALADRASVDSRVAKQLFGRATEREATELAYGVTHNDFTPRNMVMKQDGEVWIVDNEDVKHGALDYDLARCWRQWPMTPAERDAFCEAYTSNRSMDSFLAQQEFWSICTLVNTATIQSAHGRRIEPLLEALERFSRGAEDALWPERS